MGDEGLTYAVMDATTAKHWKWYVSKKALCFEVASDRMSGTHMLCVISTLRKRRNWCQVAVRVACHLEICDDETKE
jgi:hypothetical protein